MNLSDGKLKKILNNNISGSSEILLELHRHLKNEQSIIFLFPEIIAIAKKQFRSFQNIQKYLNELSKFSKSRKNLKAFFEHYDSVFEQSNLSLLNNAQKILYPYSSFITISNSKTVYDVLKSLSTSKRKLKIFVSESRPKLEGRILVKKLSLLSNVKVNLITEAMMAGTMKKIDAAIIGADSVLKNGDVVNKIGSLQLALLCKEMKIPFFVVANKNKFTKSKSFKQNIKPPTEIWRHIPSKVTIENFYFEKVDSNLITRIITD